ncbi:MULTISPECIES: hypothetical protein [Streptacidiphilus]|uniref:Uncharacterized protein n=1 Tax=Streptacidiphilus cavernicola TaxID=3342716 RepID=A0ABV6UFF5_9ACTN|nr:hypothetical protein [Streptacidiphilus jeojiense]
MSSFVIALKPAVAGAMTAALELDLALALALALAPATAAAAAFDGARR